MNPITKISDTQYSVPQPSIVVDISELVTHRAVLMGQIQDFVSQISDIDKKIASAASVSVQAAVDFIASNPATVQVVSTSAASSSVVTPSVISPTP